MSSESEVPPLEKDVSPPKLLSRQLNPVRGNRLLFKKNILTVAGALVYLLAHSAAAWAIPPLQGTR